MDKEKQIEEIADFVYADPYETYDWSDAVCLATDLYNKGYRKSEEVAREIFEEIEDIMNNIGHFDEIDFKALKNKYTESEKDK